LTDTVEKVENWTTRKTSRKALLFYQGGQWLDTEGATQGVAMKKPLTIPDESQPRNITRADLVMTEGFGLEVDGRMKTVFPTLEAAQKRARNLKAEFPMLQVKVYDAAEKKLLELSPTEWRCETIKIDRIVRLAEANVVGFNLRNGEMRPWQWLTSSPKRRSGIIRSSGQAASVGGLFHCQHWNAAIVSKISGD
jgi:hypothetical protein